MIREPIAPPSFPSSFLHSNIGKGRKNFYEAYAITARYHCSHLPSTLAFELVMSTRHKGHRAGVLL